MMMEKHWIERSYALLHDNHADAAKWSQLTALPHTVLSYCDEDIKQTSTHTIYLAVKPTTAQLEAIIQHKTEQQALFVIDEACSSHPKVWATLPLSILKDDSYMQDTFLPFWQNAVLLASDNVGAFKSEKF